METTEKNMEHGEHFNESIVNEVILEDMKKNRIDHMKYLPGMEVLEESDVMDQVISAMNAYDYDKYTEADVRRALAHDNRTPEDFQALLSPAALPLLEEIAQAAQKETRKHFGNSVYMFTPIYIANYCENYCIYCGFNCHNKIRRAKLNAEEIDKEMAAIAKTGLQEILILTGESRAKSDVKYIGEAAGFILDLMIGDPRWLYHPVCLIGNLIAFLEKILRKIFPKTDKGELAAGTVEVILVCLLSGGIPFLILHILYGISVWAGFALETFWCYQLLATKSLKTESMKVYDRLKNGTLDEARYAVSMIVGRDTQSLTAELSEPLLLCCPSVLSL